MSSLTQAMSVALSGLQTTQSLIALTSNNIANANTAGYTDKTADITSVNYGSEFGGVSVGTYQRATNQALTNDLNTATSASSYSSTQNQYLTEMQSILDSSSTNPTLSADVANFSAAWNDYASDPEDQEQQEAVVDAGQQLSQDLQSAVSQVATLTGQIQSDVGTSVTTLNADLTQIAAVNKQIQDATTSGQPTVNLQDQLSTLVNDVSTLTSVTVQSRSNGQIALFTTTGQLLVDSQSAQQFTYNGTDEITDTNGTNVTSALTGGSLQAALGFISTSAADATSSVPGVGTVAKFEAQMSELVSSLTSNTSSFAGAYDSAATASTATGATQAGQSVASSFFTVDMGQNGAPDPTTLEVNSGLTAGTADLPQTDVQSIADSFNATNNYATSGLSAQGVTYSGLTTAILSGFQTAANIVSSQSASASSQESYYQTSLTDSTGVNIDTELANLVQYQNSYAASAHVISTVDQMLTTLMGLFS